MAATPPENPVTPPAEAPEGFWEDFQKYLMESFKGSKTPPTNEAPAPEKKEEEAPPETVVKTPRKSWFGTED